MKKYLFILIIFSLVVSFSSAIKISPTQQKLIIDSPEPVCTNIWVLPEREYSISSRWSIDGKGNLENYIYSKEKIGLMINYTDLTEGKYEICFSPSKNGNFSGIIFFYSEADMAEIGSWIDLHVSGNKIGEKISLATGNIIKSFEVDEMSILLTIIFTLLLVFLVLLTRKLFFLKNQESNINYST